MKDYTEKMKKLAPIPEDMRIFWIRDDLARIEAKTPYCLQCIKEGREILCSLDDMAQIIGSNVKIVADDDMEIAKALTNSAAVLVDAEQVMDVDGALPVSGSSLDGKARRDQDYVVTTGRDPYEAFVALTVLEKAAEVQIKGDALGGVKPLPDKIIRKLRRNYINKYSNPGRARREEELTQQAPPASVEDIIPGSFFDEFRERRAMVEYGKALVEKNLVQGTWGNISVNIDDEYMLTTPSGLDYDSLGPEDMVKVNIETLEYEPGGNAPTTEKQIHGGIYQKRPDLGAIIHAHSRYCSIFAACRMPIDVKDIYLGEEIKSDLIYIADYGEAGSKELTENILKALGEPGDFNQGRRACIMSNHGMLACGADLSDAMDVAVAMEEAARTLINERLLKLADTKPTSQVEDGPTALMILDTAE